MKDSAKKILSFALAGTLVAGAGATVAHAADFGCKPTIDYTTTSDDLYYVVKKGDTLSDISVMFFGTPNYYEEIAKYNNIADSWWIYEGQTIKIPRS
jgi:nucleoid-associated protein YgaU